MFHFKKNKRSHAMHEGRERVLHLKEGCGKTRSTFQSREREREREREKDLQGERGEKNHERSAQEVTANFIAG